MGPIPLSTLETVTDIRMSDLPEFSQQRVRQTVPARDLYDAQRIVKNLERTGMTSPADECLTPSPTPSGAPSAGGQAPVPSGSATAPAGSTSSAPAGSGSATPSPSPTNCQGGK